MYSMEMNHSHEPDMVMAKMLVTAIEERLGKMDATSQFQLKWPIKKCDMSALSEHFRGICSQVRMKESAITMLSDEFVAQVFWHTGESYTVFATIICTPEKAKEVGELFHKVMKENTEPFPGLCQAEITWMFNTPKGPAEENITEMISETIHSEAYPVIGQNVDEFIDSYLDSESSVILFHGTPGTGKSRLIRYIVQRFYTRKIAHISEAWEIDDVPNPKVLFTSDRNVLVMSDQFFMTFRTGNNDFMVLEDMDNDLESREDGNDLMHKFLSSSDGFIRNNHKKIILSTNLSVNKIDEALVRPGRCFARVELGHLSLEQAKCLADKIDPGSSESVIWEENEKGYTVAQVYQVVKGQTNQHLKPMPKAGFVKGNEE